MGDRVPAIGAVDAGAVALLIEFCCECIHAAREDIGQTAQQVDLNLRRAGGSPALHLCRRLFGLGKSAGRERDQPRGRDQFHRQSAHLCSLFVNGLEATRTTSGQCIRYKTSKFH